MIQSKSKINVRYAETDQMGVVYHGNYLAWFEVGRTQLFKEQGVAYRQLETEGYYLPVVEISVKYHKPALYDDDVIVVTTLAEKPVMRIRLNYEVYRGETLLVSGTTVHVFIDKEGRPVRPPAHVAARMNELFARQTAAVS